MDYTHPHKFEGRVYYKPEEADWTQLSETPQDAMERMEFAGLPALIFPLRLVLFRPREVTERWLECMTEALVEEWSESWHDEFDIEGEADDGCRHEDYEALLEICKRMAKRSQPYNCEPSGDVLIIESPLG